MMARNDNPFSAIGWLAVLIALCAAIACGGETDWNVFETQVAGVDPQEWQLFAIEETPKHTPPECIEWNVLAAQGPKEKLLARHESPCVLLFTAPHCIGPCNEAKGPLTEMLKKSGWPVHQVDYGEEPELFDAMGVESVPTFVAVRRSVECGRYSGIDRKDLVKMLTEANERDPK